MVTPIILETIVDGPKAQVWKDWSSVEGAKSLFDSEVDIELAIDGKYEIYFDPDQPDGLKGSEGCKVLSFLPEEMLSFTWNAPPIFPVERNERTWVVIQFTEAGPGKTKVKLSHLGWREGGQRPKVREYFTKAWPHVLKNLEAKYGRNQ